MPSVTGKVYNHSKRMREKRAVLDGIAAELRRIIGEPAHNSSAQGQVQRVQLVSDPAGIQLDLNRRKPRPEGGAFIRKSTA